MAIADKSTATFWGFRVEDSGFGFRRLGVYRGWYEEEERNKIPSGPNIEILGPGPHVPY